MNLLTAAPMANERYQQFVNEQFAGTSGPRQRIVFTNRGAFHAQVVLSQMIARATRSIKIVSACLQDGIFTVPAIRQAAERRASIQVVVTDDVPLRQATALANLRPELVSGLLAVRHTPGRLVDIPHFAITDGIHLRSEKDQADNTAVIVLNADLPAADNLAIGYTNYFDALWERSTKLTVGDLLG